MKYRELSLLLPCHSLEDFPLYHTGDDADSLLACWTALWHPALLANAEAPPKWHRVDLPPEEVRDSLILVPTVSMSQLPTGFTQRAKESGAVVICREHDRPAILDKALQPLEGKETELDAELTADFLALGYAYLQIQVLTRQMRYASNLDETHFFNQLLAGATAARQNQVDEARAKLAACFDLVAEERDHYYSVDAYLLDLTLVAETTLGAALREELAAGVPVNLLLSGEMLALMAEREPESVRAIVAAMADQRAAIVGGEYCERPLPLLSCEGILAELQRGRAVYEQHLQRPVEVFGRRRFGLTPALPGILEKLQFTGAWHATLDDGHFPAASQVKTRWQGSDTGAIDAIAKPPLDASKPETFLSYAQKLGESMDSDHVATLCLAHWPRVVCPWYDDLRRCAAFTPTLGKFTTVEHYFRDTYRPGSLDRFDADQYRSPYLKQAVIRKQADPLSAIARYWARRVAADAADGLHLLANAIHARVGNEGQVECSEWVERANENDSPGLDQRLASAITDGARRLAETLPKQAGPTQTGPTESGYLVVNPFGFARRVGVEVTPLAGLPAVENPVVAAGDSGDRRFAVLELPPMGYVWLQPGRTEPARRKPDPPLAEDDRERTGMFVLRNEFFEVSIDPVTGVLKSLTDYRSRRNRLSQQLALRIPGRRGQPGDAWRDHEETVRYSVMAADEVRLATCNAALGEVFARGRLLDQQGQLLANFTQTFRLWRGSRVLELELELEPQEEPTSDVWNSYYASRFAWPDESASLYAEVNQTRQLVHKQKLESPLYVEVEGEATRLTILSGGLPFHRRVGSRMLDTLLIVRGERERRFRLGIGVDLPQALPEALSFVAPRTGLELVSPAPKPAQSWLFHVDARSVVPTHWSLVRDEGQVKGLRVRLLESSGRSGRVKLSAFRPFTAARQTNFLGETLSDCPITDGRIGIDVSAHEWIEVEGRWS
jgi:alpha-mannosidase